MELDFQCRPDSKILQDNRIFVSYHPCNSILHRKQCNQRDQQLRVKSMFHWDILQASKLEQSHNRSLMDKKQYYHLEKKLLIYRNVQQNKLAFMCLTNHLCSSNLLGKECTNLVIPNPSLYSKHKCHLDIVLGILYCRNNHFHTIQDLF